MKEFVYVIIEAFNGYSECRNVEYYVFEKDHFSDVLLNEYGNEAMYNVGEDYEYVARIDDIEDETEREEAREDYYNSCDFVAQTVDRDELVDELGEERVSDMEQNAI